MPKDKNGREIEHGDVLKVFHFIGPRRKRFYMYKVAIEIDGKMWGSHLTGARIQPNFPLWTNYYDADHYEIVASRNWRKLDKPRKRGEYENHSISFSQFRANNCLWNRSAYCENNSY